MSRWSCERRRGRKMIDNKKGKKGERKGGSCPFGVGGDPKSTDLNMDEGDGSFHINRLVVGCRRGNHR